VDVVGGGAQLETAPCVQQTHVRGHLLLSSEEDKGRGVRQGDGWAIDVCEGGQAMLWSKVPTFESPPFPFLLFTSPVMVCVYLSWPEQHDVSWYES
jgi:hypothetical protein